MKIIHTRLYFVERVELSYTPNLEKRQTYVRRLFAGIMIGLIVLTGILPVAPHDDFGSGHAHAGEFSDSISNNTTDGTPDEQNVPSVVHCSGIAHLFTAVVSVACVKPVVITQAVWSRVDVLATHITAPATPPPIL